jgi:hypothetical protein
MSPIECIYGFHVVLRINAYLSSKQAEQPGVAVSFISGVFSIPVTVWTQAIVTEGFCGFPQSLICRQLLPNSYHFIIH